MTSVHLKQTFRLRGARCSFLGTEASLRTRAQCTQIGGTPRQPARSMYGSWSTVRRYGPSKIEHKSSQPNVGNG